MGHQHHWCDEPPDGRLYFNKTFDEQYGDEEDMATNSMLTSPEELQRLRCRLAEDPDFENSSSWPKLTEWCSSCTKIRLVRLVLPPEEEKISVLTAVEGVVKKESCDAQDACTQTPSRTRKRRGGGGSRFRRLLAHQLMLSERWGLPLSRLLLRSKMKTEAKSSKVVLQKVKEEQTLPMLVKEEVVEKELEVKVEEEKEEVMPCSAGASTGGQTLFTPRSNQPEEARPTPKPFLQCPDTPPFPNFSSPFYTHNNTSPTTYISHPQHFSQSTPPYTTPFFIPPPCGGLMPGSQWVLCGGCHAWGTIMMS